MNCLPFLSAPQDTFIAWISSLDSIVLMTSQGFPVKFSETKPGVRSSPPALGEHTEATLKELGFSQEEVQRLRAGKVL